MRPLVMSRPGINQPSIAVIGVGFGGIGVAVKLKEAGFTRITLLEKASGPGGTWWHNSYPGAEVDTPSMVYSFSWMPWNWTRTHVRQAELQEYLEAVVDRFGLAPHFRFDTRVERVEWDESKQEYAIFSEGREILRANHVISAVGLLSDPKMPDWEGIGDFRGPLFHSSRWDHSVDLTGRRVAVVGSGSTATQLVPALSEIAAQVTMFQREPGWIVPKLARGFTPGERRAMDSKVAQRIIRTKILIQRERAQIGGAIWREGTPQHTAAENAARAFIKRSLDGRPDLIDAVTPRYMYAGKRPIISDDFYPSLLKENVTLIPRAVKGLTPQGLTDVEGDEYEFDAIVLATGYKADFLTSFDVIARDGRSIHDIWSGDETAFLGIMPEGVPNFFLMYGPNTNGGTIVSNLELQAAYIVAAIQHARKRDASSIEIQPWAMDVYDRILQDRLAGTAFHYENNYYRSGSGRIATQWPDGVILYGVLTKLLRKPFWRLGHRIGRTRGDKPQQAPPRPYRR
ncbi:NAD(P)/FAD-dependent oxidoreductase [Nonomuraea wenchangensis]|uniref:flavin-containing monooxygenase n=1 Tax=Nonomuraea wenchangensis TaxID=568860 RepID=UPI0034263249